MAWSLSLGSFDRLGQRWDHFEQVAGDVLFPGTHDGIEALGFIARNLNPPDFDAVMEAAGMPDAPLRAVRARPLPVTDRYAGARTQNGQSFPKAPRFLGTAGTRWRSASVGVYARI